MGLYPDAPPLPAVVGYEVAAGHQYIQDRRNFGKVLLEP
jgi:hypothetical protein